MAVVVLQALRPFELLAFRCADTHGHLELLGSERDAREAARRALIATNKALALPVGFVPTHAEAIRDQAHLANTFRYVLRQDEHHGFTHDRWLEASNLPDLIGLRTLGAWSVPHVRRALPRVDRAWLLECAGLAGLDEEELDFSRLAEAAAAAVHLARPHLMSSELSVRLGVTPRALRKLAATPPDDA